jgi:hypothetical protein
LQSSQACAAATGALHSFQEKGSASVVLKIKALLGDYDGRPASAAVLKSRLVALRPNQPLVHFWMTYQSADGSVAVVILKAVCLAEARMSAVRRGVVAIESTFVEGYLLSTRLMEGILSTERDRKMSGSEALLIICRLEARLKSLAVEVPCVNF